MVSTGVTIYCAQPLRLSPRGPRASTHARAHTTAPDDDDFLLLEHDHTNHHAAHPLKNKQRWRTLPGTPDGYDYADVEFVELDLGDASSLSSALVGCDLVVHTAGPFQRKTRPEVLEAAIEAKAS